MFTIARSRRVATGLPVAAACAVLAMSLTGCSIGGDPSSDSLSYDAGGPANTLRVKNLGGRIEVVAGDQSTIKVTETYTYTDGKPKTTHSLQNNELKLEATGCGSVGMGGKCDVRYKVEVPRDTATYLEGSGGSITVTGLSGTTYAKIGGGGVEVKDSTAKEVTAHSGGGGVILQFNGVPDKVEATTGGGSVSVKVPKGPYAVDTGDSGGRLSHVTVDVDSSSPHKIKATTGGGSVLVEAN
ncbi:hypothetical protein ACFRAR_34760 [Kitasatospora sp. NPDC056651]|uniref:hypothetical protein n=1 Tax=Kitasatospora sp. NPDC056651 TaxID=3345892 RepID=UPI0036A824A8